MEKIVFYTIKLCYKMLWPKSNIYFSFHLESVLLEWQKRNYYCKNFEFLSVNDFFELSDKYSLTHLLTFHDQVGAFNNFPSLWNNKDFILYDINDMKNSLKNNN